MAKANRYSQIIEDIFLSILYSDGDSVVHFAYAKTSYIPQSDSDIVRCLRILVMSFTRLGIGLLLPDAIAKKGSSRTVVGDCWQGSSQIRV